MSDNYCGNCKHMDKNSKNWFDEYYCNESRKYQSESKKACPNFIKKDPGGYKPAGCFITTIICKRLNFSDDCEQLRILRSFRENYLKNTKEGRELLQVYDSIGPIISYYVGLDSEENVLYAYNNFLIPCIEYVKEQKYELAKEKYIDMVGAFVACYLIQGELNTKYNKEEDLGKGRTKTRV